MLKIVGSNDFNIITVFIMRVRARLIQNNTNIVPNIRRLLVLFVLRTYPIKDA